MYAATGRPTAQPAQDATATPVARSPRQEQYDGLSALLNESAPVRQLGALSARLNRGKGVVQRAKTATGQVIDAAMVAQEANLAVLQDWLIRAKAPPDDWEEPDVTELITQRLAALAAQQQPAAPAAPAAPAPVAPAAPLPAAPNPNPAAPAPNAPAPQQPAPNLPQPAPQPPAPVQTPEDRIRAAAGASVAAADVALKSFRVTGSEPKATAIAQRYAAITAWTMSSVNVDGLAGAVTQGILTPLLTRQKLQNVESSYFAFAFAGTTNKLKLHYHIHWRSAVEPAEAHFKNKALKGGFVRTTAQDDAKMRAALGDLWGVQVTKKARKAKKAHDQQPPAGAAAAAAPAAAAGAGAGAGADADADASDEERDDGKGQG